jgi:hypothetical protein
METNFNFNSQACTSKVQSERLLALGLKKETADMVHSTIVILDNLVDLISAHPWTARQEVTDYWYPAWSLHRLLCFLPKHIQVYDEVWKFKRNLYLSIDEDFNIRYEENIDEPCFDKTFWAYDIYQNCIDAIEWLIKEGHFPKEYLV